MSIGIYDIKARSSNCGNFRVLILAQDIKEASEIAQDSIVESKILRIKLVGYCRDLSAAKYEIKSK